MQQPAAGSDWLSVAEQIAEEILFNCEAGADRESTEALEFLREATETRKGKPQATDS